jgi:sucrose synthase
MTMDANLFASLEGYMRERSSESSKILHGLASDGAQLVSRSHIENVARSLREENHGLADSPLLTVLDQAQLVVIQGSWVYCALRPRIGRWTFLRFHLETQDVEQVSVRHFLRFKERVAHVPHDDRDVTLEIDLAPFERWLPKMKESGSIGRGAEYLNRRLASKLFDDLDEGAHRLLDFLRAHKHEGQQLLIGPGIGDLRSLRQALREAVGVLGKMEAETTWAELEPTLGPLGFAVGWGADAARALETMELLLDLLEAPTPRLLESFLGRVPMIFNVAIVSPHGWFGQSGVLGRPDTGGQIVYILDQVRALEREMRSRLHDQGLFIEPRIVVLTRLIPEADGTSCDQRVEPIAGTKNARILRLPFRDETGEVVPQWVSRFEIWPYLECFAFDALTELLAELGGRPDLIIGNYSDGNLVASLLAHRMKVTLVTIAHALEQSKYANSDLFWHEHDEQYHFSCQFTADLISMNAADFIITSSYQEIAGTEQTLGQYESYSFLTMPGLYRVVQGIDVYDPKFNIVSPGADPTIYFSATEEDRRLHHLHGEIRELVYGHGAGSDFRGSFEDESKPLLFTMARMDRVKNITGLTEWFAKSDELRAEVNLLVASGHVDAERSQDVEERAGIHRMHELFDEHGLDGHVRWVEGQVSPQRNGELYRVVADTRGAFVQPAVFEAFGLTVIEAMSTGLPTFATCHGGPLEIIEDGVSGFHIDPNHGAEAAAKMAACFARWREDESAWQAVSSGALARIEERYTWKGYAERLMTLSRLYGFWRHATDLERRETRRYLEMLYALQYRPIARALSR